MKVIGVIIGAVLGIGLILLLVPAYFQPKTATRQDSSLQIREIRGDSLGMQLAEYRKKHPYECYAGTCTAQETYAGVPALKLALFTKDGKLWRLRYSSDDKFAEQILAALKEKYGDPGAGCSHRTGYSCRWTNGNATASFLNTGKYAVAEFTDEPLGAKWSKEYEEQKAKERKTDQ